MNENKNMISLLTRITKNFPEFFSAYIFAFRVILFPRTYWDEDIYQKILHANAMYLLCHAETAEIAEIIEL